MEDIGRKMHHILLIEDNVSYRQSLKETLLERFPAVVVHEAGDGRGAMALLRDQTPDLIFMDIRLSGENGLNILKKIRKRHARLPVIILTNYDLPEYRQAADRYGADSFLHKATARWPDIARAVGALLPGAARAAFPSPGE